MKSPLLILSVFCCLACAALAVEPDASPAPSASPARHHRRHHAVAAAASPTPAESPVPHKSRWGLGGLFGHSRKKPAPASPAASPVAAPSPTPSQHWSIRHLFGRHEKAPAPTPTPSPTPAVKIHKKHKRAAAAETAPTSVPPPDEAQPAPSPAEPGPEPSATPEPKPRHKASGITSQVPFVPGPSERVHPPASTKSPVATAAEQTQRFQEVKTKALADKKVQELQEKADNATGDESRPALRQYYKALYSRMREIDPTLRERIQRTEAASLRRADNQVGQ